MDPMTYARCILVLGRMVEEYGACLREDACGPHTELMREEIEALRWALNQVWKRHQ